MSDEMNEFDYCYSYSYNKETCDGVDGFEVSGWSEKTGGIPICFTTDEKVAKYLENHFDNLAIDEERELFEGLVE